MDKKEKEKYLIRVRPYFEPEGMVYVWCQIEEKRRKWKLIRMNNVPVWTSDMGNTDVFYSINQYTAHARDFQEPEDQPYFCHMYFDFDSDEDLNESKADCLKFCDMVSNILPLSPQTLRIWYTGNRGFHVTIDARLFGVEPNPKTHRLYGIIAAYYKEFMELKTLDLNVYSYRRMWRIPNSKRSSQVEIRGEKRDQYKIEIKQSELSMMSVEELRELATSPREPLFDECEYDDISPEESAMDWFEPFREQFRQEERLRLCKVKKTISMPEGAETAEPVCIRAVLNYKIAQDRRNRATLNLAVFYRDVGKTEDETLDIITNWAENVPWAGHKTRERISNARSVVRRIFGPERESANFACQFIRSMAAEGESIPCAFKRCEFVKDSQQQADIIKIELFETIRPEFYGKVCQSQCHIVAMKDEAFSIPLRIRCGCSYIDADESTKGENCGRCAMPSVADNVENKTMKAMPLTRSFMVQWVKHGLIFIGISDKMKKDIIRGLAGINGKCRTWWFEEEMKGTLRTMYLRSTINPVHNSYYMTWREENGADVKRQLAFMVDSDGSQFYRDRNLDIMITAVPVSSPKDQSIHLAVTNIEDGYTSLDAFKVNEQVYEQLNRFRAKPGELWELIEKRAEFLAANVTRIRDRFELTLANDLVFHSPPYIALPNESDERGMLQLLVIGDPGQGKSSTSRSLSNFYQLGRFVEGGASGRTGLLYTIDMTNRLLIWGVLPQEDRKIVILDEFNQINPDDVAQLTAMRTNGRVDVNKTVSGSTWARIRMIMLANPMGGGKLNQYNNGVEPLVEMMPHQQDIRRLDMVMLTRSSDVDLEIVNQAALPIVHSDVYTSSACSNLILWAWTRTPENIVWSSKAVEHLLSYSVSMAKYFECDVSLVEGADMRYRLGRIAQSFAVMGFSSDNKGEKLWITEEHIKAAAKFLHMILTKTGKMDMDDYARMWQKRNHMDDTQATMLNQELTTIEHFEGFAQIMLSQTRFSRTAIMEAMGILDYEQFREKWKLLIGKSMFVESGGYYVKAPKLTQWLKERVRAIDATRSDIDLAYLKD